MLSEPTLYVIIIQYNIVCFFKLFKVLYIAFLILIAQGQNGIDWSWGQTTNFSHSLWPDHFLGQYKKKKSLVELYKLLLV